MVARLIGVFTSLKLAVVLLAFSIAVVFFGTLAQTSDGLYLAQKRYFQSWFSTWSPHSAPWLIVPLPGGYLLGTLLLLNLAGAYAKRLQFTAKKTGILLVHVGIVLLLLGQLATDLFARESRMSFAEGEARNFTEAFQDYELAVLTDNSDPSKDDVVAFPQGLVARGGELSHSAIPFRFRVLEWMPNSAVQFRAPMLTNGPAQATEGIGLGFEFLSRPLTGKMDDKNVPTARVEVLGADGKALGTWVVSGYSGDSTMARIEARNWALNFGEELAARLYPRLIAPQTVNVGGKRYQFLLRPERYYEPYSLRLVQTTHEVYPGTDTPKNFQSRVRIENVTTGENREVDIRMNSPLRYKGLTFFQLQMGREELEQGGRGTSVLQVVKNPSWITPYVGCILVGGGMTVQFLIHLVGFLSPRRRAVGAQASGVS